MKLLQVTMGHASIMVTAHTYADLYDSAPDRPSPSTAALVAAAAPKPRTDMLKPGE